MNQTNILRKVQCLVPVSGKLKDKCNYYITIDFETGLLSMEASQAKNSAKGDFNITADIFYSHVLNLTENKSAEAVFYLQGKINDGPNTKRLTGICSIDKSNQCNGGWQINFVLQSRKLHNGKAIFEFPVSASLAAA